MRLFASLTFPARDYVASHFPLLWLLCLICIAVSGYWLSRKSYSPGLRRCESGGVRLQLTRSDVGCLILFGIFVAAYIAVMLHKEDFAFFDNDQLTDFSVVGRALHPLIWPAEGRFFPLAFQEFNALRFITRSAVGYQLFAAGQLLIALLVLSFILTEFRLRYRLLVVSALMLAPAFSISFTGLVYPERDVLFWLTIFVLCLQRYSETRAPAYFVACLICAHFALYYKETVVIFLTVFAACYLLFQFHDRPRGGHRPSEEFLRQNALYFGLLGVCAVYAAFFVATMLPWGHSSYVAEHQQPIRSVLQTYLVIDWIAWLLLVALVLRVARWLKGRNGLDPLWDSLAAGALAYFIVILGLRLISGYYLAPVDLIAFLYLGRLGLAWLPKARRAHVALVATGVLCLLIHDAAYSSFRMIERKGIIIESRRFADFLQDYSRHARGTKMELYFPYATGHQLAALSAYLRYRGLALAETGSIRGVHRTEFAIEGSRHFPAKRCMDNSDYVCVHEDAAPPGALVIVMPDDFVSIDDVRELTSESATIFRVETPEFVAKNEWLRSLYVVSPEFAATGLPGHWLQLDVFENPGASNERSGTLTARNQLAGGAQ